LTALALRRHGIEAAGFERAPQAAGVGAGISQEGNAIAALASCAPHPAGCSCAATWPRRTRARRTLFVELQYERTASNHECFVAGGASGKTWCCARFAPGFSRGDAELRHHGGASAGGGVPRL